MTEGVTISHIDGHSGIGNISLKSSTFCRGFSLLHYLRSIWTYYHENPEIMKEKYKQAIFHSIEKGYKNDLNRVEKQEEVKELKKKYGRAFSQPLF